MRFKRLFSIIDSINENAGRLIAYIVLFMTFSVVFEVIARYIFNRPTIWSMEINQYLLCIYTSIAGGYALLHKSHVNVDIIYGRFGVRTRAVVDIFTSFFFFAFIFILIWKSWGMAKEAWVYNEHSESLLAAPLFPSKIAIPLGGLLILLQGLAKFLRDLGNLVTGTEEVNDSINDFIDERRKK